MTIYICTKTEILSLEALKNVEGAASAQQQPDRGEHEHLVHHLDVEELVHHLDVGELVHHLDVEELGHDELLRFDEQLRLAATSLRALLVLQGGTFFPNVALSSVQSPQTPAYASTQYSKKFSSGIYFLEGFGKIRA